MHKFLFFFLIFISCISSAQNIEKIIAQNRLQLERIEVKPSNRITYISSNFAEPQITTIDLRDKVKMLAVTKVYYVYTAYKRSVNFNQKALDRDRFAQLKILYPVLFESSLIEWEIIEQTGLAVHTEGSGYFHGFILVHRPLPTDDGRKFELDFVSNHLESPSAEVSLIIEDPFAELFKEKVEEIEETKESKNAIFIGDDQALLEYIQTNFEIPNEVWKDRKDFWAKFAIEVDEMGKATLIGFKESYGKQVEKSIKVAIANMPNWQVKNVNGRVLKDTIDFEWRVSYSPQLKGMYLKDGKPPSLNHNLSSAGTDLDPPARIGARDIVSGSVYRALSNLPEYEKLAIVMDVTGSMANHIISTSFWLNKNKDKLPFTSFTAFNDGDQKEDAEKVIGATGGIYFTSFANEFRNSIRTAMLNGNGGDYPENDIEAVLYAIRKDAKATGILLIADNFSAVKDFELLKKITLPVSVLPCGLTGSINQNYLDIVCETKGKIFYNDQVIDPTELKKGETFKIRRTNYVYTGKRIEVVN